MAERQIYDCSIATEEYFNGFITKGNQIPQDYRNSEFATFGKHLEIFHVVYGQVSENKESIQFWLNFWQGWTRPNNSAIKPVDLQNLLTDEFDVGIEVLSDRVMFGKNNYNDDKYKITLPLIQMAQNIIIPYNSCVELYAGRCKRP